MESTKEDMMLWIVGLLWVVVIGGTFLDDSLEYERWIGRVLRGPANLVSRMVHRVR